MKSRPLKHKIPVIGLTGSIGSGKTAAANIFKNLGAEIIDADLLAREVVAPGTPALSEIVETFGKGVLSNDGNLDRKALAAIVFPTVPVVVLLVFLCVEVVVPAALVADVNLPAEVVARPVRFADPVKAVVLLTAPLVA